jgi:hypothetical protein
MQQWWKNDLQGETKDIGENAATSSTSNLNRVYAMKSHRGCLTNITSYW